MTTMARLWMAMVSVMFTASAALAQQPAATDGFVPAQSLPPTEQMPAAPLLISAYSVFLVLMMFYLWTIWRRIGKVEQEMQDLVRRQAGQGR